MALKFPQHCSPVLTMVGRTWCKEMRTEQLQVGGSATEQAVEQCVRTCVCEQVTSKLTKLGRQGWAGHIMIEASGPERKVICTKQ